MSRSKFVLSKIQTAESISRKVELWKLKGDKIVFTNGCFDILHKGHVSYLMEAASLGNRLVVGLNTDQSVKSQNKGADRPVNPEDARLLVLASLGFVDAVILFEEETPINLIRIIKPDVLVKGGDYNPEQKDSTAKDYIVGSDLVKNAGGEVKTIELVDGFSTTALINRLKS